MDILGLVGTIFSGGITGVVGAAVTKFGEYKNKQLDYAHDVAMRDYDIKVLDKEIEGKTRVATIEGEAAKDVEMSKIIETSYIADKANYSNAKTSKWMIIVDFLRGIIRPSTTLYFLVLASYVFYEVQGLAESKGIALSIEQVYSLYEYTILWILYTTGMVLGWWFGARASGTAPVLSLRK